MSSTADPQETASQFVSAKGKVPLLAKIALIALLIPANFSLGPLSMSPSRLLFLALVPVLLVNLFRGQYGKVLWMDIFVCLNLFWLTLSIFVNNPDQAVQFTGSIAVVVLGGYLIARATIRSAEHFASLCRFLGYLVLVSVPFVMFEATTSRIIPVELVDRIPGVSGVARATNEQRLLGLYRVQFTFAHPIHYGFFCALIFAMVLSGLQGAISRGERWLLGGAAAFCCLLSVSSAAVLTIAVQFGLILWAWIMRSVKRRWSILLIGSAVAYVIIDIISDRPAIIAILSRLAFNSGTVTVRQRLFEFGTEQIGRTPWLGVGYNDWGLPPWMSGSIDNFWLLQAVIYGLPALFFLAGAFVLGVVLVGLRPLQPNSPMRNLRLGWVFMMVGMNLTLATVALFSVMYSLAFFFFGAGMWIVANEVIEEEASDPVETAPGPRSTAPQYSRFGPASAQATLSRTSLERATPAEAPVSEDQAEDAPPADPFSRTPQMRAAQARGRPTRSTPTRDTVTHHRRTQR